MVKKAKDQNGKNKKIVFLVIIVVLLGKIIGLLKQMVVSSVYGTNINTDIISISQDFVSTIQYILTQMILTAFTSIYIYEKKKGRGEACSFISEVLKFFLLVSSSCTLLIILTSPFIASILAPSYSAELTSLLANYLIIYSFTLIPFSVIAIFSAILNSNDKYVLHELSIVIQNVVVIVVVLIFNSFFGIDALVVATFSYVMVNSVYLCFFSRKYMDLRTFNTTHIFKSYRIKSLVKMLLPLLIGFSMVYINQQVDKILVSGMEGGTITCLSYGASLSNLVTSIIASLCTIFYTKITNALSEKNYEKTYQTVSSALMVLISAVVPIMGITLVCSNEIVAIIFQRGNFSPDSTKLTAAALFGYSFSFIPFSLKSIFDRLHYGNKKSIWPMVASFISLIINVSLSVILSGFLGVMGVTLASSIAEGVSAIIIIVISFSKFKWLKAKKLLLCIPLWAIGLAVSMTSSYYMVSICENLNVGLRFILSATISIGAYLISIFPLYFGSVSRFLSKLLKRSKMRIE